MGYLGSKGASGAYQAVIAAMPPHDTYIETHLGSGFVMRSKPPASRQIGVELDPIPLDLFRRLPFAQRDPKPELVRGDAVAFLRRFDFARAGRVLVYADPPYVLATRSSKKRYRHDYTDQQHRALIATLRELQCAVILSGYPSELYDQLVGDWRQLEFQVMTRGGPRTEKLWLNFPAGDVQWGRFAGANYIDRQRIKRKAANWGRMYAALPHGERLAVLASILAVHGSPQTPATVSAAPATTDAGDDAEGLQ